MENAKMDFIGANGAQGDVAGYMASKGRLDPGNMRPFVKADGRVYVTVYTGGDPKKKESYRDIHLQANDLQTNGTLRPYEWRQLDEAVVAGHKVIEGELVGIPDHGPHHPVFGLDRQANIHRWRMHDPLADEPAGTGQIFPEGDG